MLLHQLVWEFTMVTAESFRDSCVNVIVVKLHLWYINLATICLRTYNTYIAVLAGYYSTYRLQDVFQFRICNGAYKG